MFEAFRNKQDNSDNNEFEENDIDYSKSKHLSLSIYFREDYHSDIIRRSKSKAYLRESRKFYLEKKNIKRHIIKRSNSLNISRKYFDESFKF